MRFRERPIGFSHWCRIVPRQYVSVRYEAKASLRTSQCLRNQTGTGAICRLSKMPCVSDVRNRVVSGRSGFGRETPKANVAVSCLDQPLSKFSIHELPVRPFQQGKQSRGSLCRTHILPRKWDLSEDQKVLNLMMCRLYNADL